MCSPTCGQLSSCDKVGPASLNGETNPTTVPIYHSRMDFWWQQLSQPVASHALPERSWVGKICVLPLGLASRSL